MTLMAESQNGNNDLVNTIIGYSIDPPPHTLWESQMV